MPNIILEIVGTGFNLDFEDNLVTFNLGAVGIVTAATTTKLTVQLTTHPTTTGSLTAVVASPLSSGSPVQVAIVALGVVGTVDAANRSIVSTSTLTIAGTGFDTTAANNTVTFNLNAVGTVTSATTTELVVTFSTFPDALGSLTAIVDVVDYLSSIEFEVATIVAQAVVTENLTTHPLNEATLIIDGTGFDSVTPANNIVTFSNGAIGTVTAATAIELTVTLTTFPTNNETFTAIVNSFGGDSEEEIVGFYNGITDEGLTALLSTNGINHTLIAAVCSEDNNYIYFTDSVGDIKLYSRNTSTGLLTYVSGLSFSNKSPLGIYDSTMVISSTGLHLFSISANSAYTTSYLNKFTRNNSTGAIAFDSQISIGSALGVGLKFNANKTKLYVATQRVFKRYSVSSGVLSLDWSTDLEFEAIEQNDFTLVGSFVISNNENFSVILTLRHITINFDLTITPIFIIVDNSDGSNVDATVVSGFSDSNYASGNELTITPNNNYILFQNDSSGSSIIVATLDNNGDMEEVFDSDGVFDSSLGHIFVNHNGRIIFTFNYGAKLNLLNGELSELSTISKPTFLLSSKDNKFIYGWSGNSQEYKLFSFISLGN